MPSITTITIFFLFLNISSINAQGLYKWKDIFSSTKYPYSITIPKSFKKVQAKGKHIDLKFIDDYGASILVNVTPLLADEYKITPHSYSKEWLEKEFKQAFPNFTIHRSEKILIDGQKAFISEATGGVNSKVKSMDCYLFYKDKAYVITATAPITKFSNYRLLFKNAIKSINFK